MPGSVTANCHEIAAALDGKRGDRLAPGLLRLAIDGL
jgi:hypothetical protein